MSTAQAEEIAKTLFGITGTASQLDGDVDFNYRIKSADGTFILKVSRPNEDEEYLDFQQKIIQHIAGADADATIAAPRVIPDLKGRDISRFIDDTGTERKVRLLTWVTGRLWSSVNPKTDKMRYQLGELCGKMTTVFQGFEHSNAHRIYEWDLAQARWTGEHVDRFEGHRRAIIEHFQESFRKIQSLYADLRKSVVHSDANDNNIIVDSDRKDPKVIALIDFGDAVYTQTVNDVAIVCAYAILHQHDPLAAILPLVKGYNSVFKFTDEELRCLYTLIATRLVISVTKSSINRAQEPDNEYLVISEKPAWDALEKWALVNAKFAYYSFRNTCGFDAHPLQSNFKDWAFHSKVDLATMFPTVEKESLVCVDLSVQSTLLGNRAEYEDYDLMSFKLSQFQKKNPKSIVAGGYLEVRPFYTTEVYRSEGNSGYNYRNTHLGVDFWLPAGTAIHSPYDGTVIAVHDNDSDKDYGPTIILEYTFNGQCFYALYGHLSKESLNGISIGQKVKRGEKIASIGDVAENGNWIPHLHFQLMLDLIGNTTDFPGTCTWSEKNVWSGICPNPLSIFQSSVTVEKNGIDSGKIITYRTNHLGKSLSLSYADPLVVVRGEGAHLIDITGRKFLDTVNNVAHVGHEHPRVVTAGQQQMALLNTNTRYLHENINEFAQELLATFPPELEVVHFVNSGSEANELALRMAKACTQEKDIIAVEIGYHGNANACIDISSYKFDGKGGSGAPEHTHIVPLPDAFRGIYQGAGTGEKYASHVHDRLNEIQKKGRNVAAFIAEPIISCGGQIELPKGYLKDAYKAVRNAGGLCISDEVQVGFGRVGTAFWGFQLHDVIPDIVTVGKPIGNGHPLAAVICTKEVAEKFANGMEYFNTFGGNPVSSTIGREVLRVIREEKLQENALNVGHYLKSKLKELQKSYPIIGDVRGQGLFLGFELTDADKHPLAEQADYLANRMKDLGILMSTDGPQYNVLKIKPPMVFSTENADELILRLETIFQEDFMQL